MTAIKRIFLQKKFGVLKIFVDTSTAIDLNGTIFDLFFLLRDLYEKEHVNRNTNVALLLPFSSKAKEITLFYELVSQNRGWNTKAFSRRDAAFEWFNSECK